LCQRDNQQPINDSPSHDACSTYRMIQAIIKESSSDVLDLTNEEVPVTIKEK
jgi:hypothetical protein